MYNYNCPDCEETKLQSDKNVRKINEVIEKVNALIDVNNETVDFIELEVLDNDPVSVPDNKARLYIIKNESGKIELRVRIGGNNIVLATQP